jgi:N-acetyl-1-D-myo-inositol-2-amino-2-deoxy-alpha-D-glucopyranoside deacetylase
MPADPGDLTGRSLLAVFAHPDDESLSCGGTLAWCAEQGARVTLLCVTRGEDAAPAGGNREALREQRSRELTEAGSVLGIHDLVMLDYPDGELAWLDPVRAAALETDISAAIQRTRADIVVTFGEDGLYWHPDHIALHQKTTAAVSALGDSAPALYYVTMPRGAIRAIVEQVERQSPDGHRHRMVFGIDDPDAFGVLAATPSLIVDVSRFAGRKLAALKCHESQLEGGALSYIRDEDAPRLLGVEHFRRAPVGAVGPSFLDRFA